ncbi:Fe-S cluster assembly protein SufD [Nitrosomonas sp. JL21]|uniref:Fe-S cluster assembly protein SufD n=1 Tax=Nitrosomonas sp. JL21 TaxID=153949 RepID=UPI00136B08C3|nr:Fe-S cluster assembly protein SufD [Nitrosomonas sp. JL21]MBL8497994.1 Fe-S cluster assembly protein SufD [Nitrosomonas sp.]MCC7091720.1 Fe-S cluster assembly protein SufD [Nitrosomonas sp.]MXS78766.1 Fe-S cluster assembly protein SufD [Nitrosomonas sp. JL21]
MTESPHADYLAGLLRSWSEKPTRPLSWLNELRAEAIDRVSKQAFPTKRDEEWRFTDISTLTHLPYLPSRPETSLQLQDIDHLFLPEAKNRLVFVDGHFHQQLSSLKNPDELIIGNLPDFSASHSSILESHLGQHAAFDHNIFTALNTAFLRDSALLIIPKNTTVADPVHLLFIAIQPEVTSYPRCLLIGEMGSSVTLVEEYATLAQSAYITNSVTEIALAANAHANHVRIQRESKQAFHLANCSVALDHASRYQSTSLSLGSQISRYNLDIRLAEEAAECSVDGLTLISNRQLADTHTCIDHVKPNGTSHQQHKCIVDGAAHAVFNGKIIVRPHAQRTNSSQSSRNLLLSKTAQIDTKPQLEIFADDVKCAHGATVGQLDPEEIFYLKSRGLSEVAARNLLTYAFGAEIISRISIPSLKQQLEQIVLNQTQSN